MSPSYMENYKEEAVDLICEAVKNGSIAYSLFDDHSLVLLIRWDPMTSSKYAGLYKFDTQKGTYILKGNEYRICHEFCS